MIVKKNLIQENDHATLEDYLCLIDVTKQFGPVTAVNRLTLSVGEGEFFALLGPSGCGKTTTLRLVAGLERPSGGRIWLAGRDITNIRPQERDVGMVFQDYALYPHMSLFENIAYPLKVRKVARKEIERRVFEVAERLGIEELLNRRPAQVSGGQQQRAAVARALVYKPKVFLFDEPLSNLDAKLRLEARAFLKHLQKEERITTIYVTHDQAEAMAMADRIGIMDQGKLLQVGNPFEVFHSPKNTFVASFIGNPPMNLLPCSLECCTDGAFLVGEGFKLDISVIIQKKEMLIDFLRNKRLFLGFRPEHALISESAEKNAIHGRVYAVQPLGAETLVTIEVGDFLVSVRLFVDQLQIVSKRVWIRVNPQRIYIFSESGERLWP